MSLDKFILNPTSWIYVLAFVIPFGQLQKYFGDAFSAAKIVTLIMFFLAVAYKSVKKEAIIKSPMDLPLLLFVISFIPSFALTSDFNYMLLVFFNVAGYLILNIVIVNFIVDKKKLMNIINIIFISTLIISVLGIIQFMTGLTYLEVTGRETLYKWDTATSTELSYYRVLGVEKNPSAFANYFIYSIPLIFSIFIISKGTRKIVLLFLLFIASIVLVLTFSRSGIVATIIGLSVVAIFYMKKKKYISSLIFFFAASGIIFYLFWPSEINYYALPFLNINKDLSFQERIWTIEPTILMFLDNPFFGVGFGNYLYNISDYGFSGLMAPHNSFFGIAGEIGLFGLIAFIIILILFIKIVINGIRKTNDPQLRGLLIGLLGSFVGLQIMGLTHANYINVALWFIIGLSMASAKIVQKEILTRI